MSLRTADISDSATTRVCRGCDQRKELELFYRDHRAPRGRSTICKACWRARRKARDAGK